MVAFLRPYRGLGGNDPAGELHESTFAPGRLELLKLDMDRADGFGLLRRCRLSQVGRDEDGDKNRLLGLDGLDYPDVEVRNGFPFPFKGWVQGVYLEVKMEIMAPQHLPCYLQLTANVLTTSFMKTKTAYSV